MIGKLFESINKVREINSEHCYHKVLVFDEDGHYETLMMTEHELSVIRQRSERNRDEELVPKWHDKAYVSAVFSVKSLFAKVF
jgi:hypothetical protein